MDTDSALVNETEFSLGSITQCAAFHRAPEGQEEKKTENRAFKLSIRSRFIF